MQLSSSRVPRINGIVSILVSYESKFILFGSDGRRYARRSVTEKYYPKCVKSSVKFGGGSVMVFGMISGACPRPVELHARINAHMYKELVEQHVLPALRSAANQSVVFMQNNAQCHSATSIKSSF